MTINPQLTAIEKLKQAPWVLDIRPVDAFVVSRYRQAWRQGAKFPPLIADKDTGEIISGNHRWQAAMDEFGPDFTIPVYFEKFKSRADALRIVAESNATHGVPMDGITRRRLTIAMLNEGVSEEEIAKILGVAVTRLRIWGKQSITVQIGRKYVARPVKAGIDTETVKTMTKNEYREHIDRDQGLQARYMAEQLTRWLHNGWVNFNDEATANAVRELGQAIVAIMNI